MTDPRQDFDSFARFDRFVATGELPSADQMRADIERWTASKPERDEEMTTGQIHAERRAAQAAAAQPPVNRRRVMSRPGKGNRNNWKRDER